MSCDADGESRDWPEALMCLSRKRIEDKDVWVHGGPSEGGLASQKKMQASLFGRSLTLHAIGQWLLPEPHAGCRYLSSVL